MIERSLPSGTELFSLTSQNSLAAQPLEHVVVCGEEIGGTHALMPVVRELLTRDVSVTAMLAGNGRRILNNRGHEHDIQAEPLSEWPTEARDPAAVLITPSEDGRLEEDLLHRFPGEPTIVIEDFYESSRRSISHAAALGVKSPTVCVIDSQAQKLIGQRFPDVEVPTVITGSPTFDALFREDVAAVRHRIKTELGIADKKLVALVLPRLGHASLAEEVATALQGFTDPDVVFATRRHPGDPVPWSTYEQMFAGLPIVPTASHHTDEVAAASDVFVGQRSVTSLRSVVRQQPTITLNKYVLPGFSIPLAETGATLTIEPPELPQAITELLEGTSDRYQRLLEKMRPYKVDGQAARRVADVVCATGGLAHWTRIDNLV